MADITKRGSAWRARCYTSAGKRVSRTFNTKKAALDWCALQRANKVTGVGLPVESRMKLADWLTYWLESIDVADHTLRSYRTVVNHISDHVLGSTRLDALNGLHARAWMTEYAKTRQASTVRAGLKTLKASLTFAVSDGVLLRNPISAVKSPKVHVDRTNELPTVAEIRRLFDALPQPHSVAFLLMVATGARWGECYGLQRGDVDLKLSTVTFRHTLQQNAKLKDSTKTGGVRVVLLDEVLRGGLAVTLKYATTEFVFGRVEYSRWLKRIWNPACVEAGVSMRPHDCRRWNASQLNRLGVPLGSAMSRLGHESSLLHASYLRANLADQLEAVEAIAAALRV